MKPDKELLRNEFGKIWKSKGSIEHSVNDVAVMVVLSDGYIYPIHKQTIETRFCFGEDSQKELEEALDMCNYARTNENYFIEQNMNYIIKQIEDFVDCSLRFNIVIVPQYSTQERDCKLVKTLVLDSNGYAIYSNRVKCDDYIRVLNNEDKKAIIYGLIEYAIYRQKQLQTYLKRFGLSKIHAWTYWISA